MDDKNTPATRAYLREVEAKLGARIEAVEQKLGARIDGVEARIDRFEEKLLERIEKVETDLLTEFRLRARRSDARTKATTVLVNSFDERLGDREDQVAELRDRIE